MERGLNVARRSCIYTISIRQVYADLNRVVPAAFCSSVVSWPHGRAEPTSSPQTGMSQRLCAHDVCVSGGRHCRRSQHRDLQPPDTVTDGPYPLSRQHLIWQQRIPSLSGVPVKIRIMLAEDQAMVRAGLRLILEREADMAVIGEAQNGTEAVALALHLQPTIVVLDIDQFEANGLDALERIKAHAPQIRVVVISGMKNELYLERALRGGASGYVLKHHSADHLVRAVRTVARGGLAVDWFGGIEPADAQLPGGRSGLRPPPHSSLTGRERDVLQLVAQGYSNTGIATHLGISCKTVDTHRTHLMDKLDLHTRVDLTRYALHHGYLIVA